MSSFFRRPGDSDSDTSSGSSFEEEASESIDRSTAPHDEEEGQSNSANAPLSKTESVSSTASFVNTNDQAGGTVPNVDQIRNMMLTTLLEDFYKSQAAQLLNGSLQGARYDKESAEVQPLAAKLFAEGSRALALNGLIQPVTPSAETQSTRRQFLLGLGNLSLSAIKDNDLQAEPSHRRLPPATTTTSNAANQLVLRRPSYNPEMSSMFPDVMQNLMMHTGRMSVSTPQSDLQLTTFASRRSHYESSFRELRLLGKGGFGRVYHAYNLFDKKEYAVKKIALSPRMSQRYREAGHQELESVLREVQALAALDHSNVVRYHATWIEEPRVPPAPLFDASRVNPFRAPQKLLANLPATMKPRVPVPHPISGHSDGIVFELDSVSGDQAQNIEPGPQDWSPLPSVSEQLSLRESEIFSDGQARQGNHIDLPLNDAVFVLHVQMSLYPSTLAQYLAPSSASTTDGSSPAPRRHCFHLVPALHILLGILCGLQYIHARGLIHRDIKPSNIFLSSIPYTGSAPAPALDECRSIGSCHGCESEVVRCLNPRIGDFGLVTQLAQTDSFSSIRRRSGSERNIGTEYYRPPIGTDQRGRRVLGVVDEKVDMFALGVVMVELLWPCSTSSERLQILKDVQRTTIPVGLAARVDLEGHDPGTGQMVEQCIRAMIEPDSAKRSGCAEIHLRIRELLARCCANKDPGVGCEEFQGKSHQDLHQELQHVADGGV